MAADSTSAQRRRVTKPLMEKKRRARINSCLAELKRIVTEKEGTADHMEGRTSRLEKADILEMTVRFLRKSGQESKPTGFQGSPEVTRYNTPSSDSSFTEGFRSCVIQVEKFLSLNHHQWTEDESLSSMMLHLQQYLLKVQTTGHFELSSRCSSSASSSSQCSSPTALSPEYSDSYSLIANKCRESFNTRSHKNSFSFVPLIVGFKDIANMSSSSKTFTLSQHTKRNNTSVNELGAQNSASAVWRPWDAGFSEKRV